MAAPPPLPLFLPLPPAHPAPPRPALPGARRPPLPPPAGRPADACHGAGNHRVAAGVPELAGAKQPQRAGPRRCLHLFPAPRPHLRPVALPSCSRMAQSLPWPLRLPPSSTVSCCRLRRLARSLPPACCCFERPPAALFFWQQQQMLLQRTADRRCQSGQLQGMQGSPALRPTQRSRTSYSTSSGASKLLPFLPVPPMLRAVLRSLLFAWAGRGNYPPRRGDHCRLAQCFFGGAQSAPGPHRQPDRLPAAGTHL